MVEDHGVGSGGTKKEKGREGGSAAARGFVELDLSDDDEDNDEDEGMLHMCAGLFPKRHIS
jgi:hypothetical protein